MCQAERGRFRGYAAAVSATTPAAREPALEALRARVSACTRCPELVRARTQVVFGTGPADADLVFVGEAPGPAEDREGDPLTGAAGALLDELLAGIGRSRADVAIVTIVRCRPPENRSPQRAEIERCREYLDEQLAVLAPVVVCPLGTFATRALRGDRAPVTAVRGAAEVRTLGTRAVRLYPLLHPAAALYAPETVAQLREDVAGIPALLALGAPEQPVGAAPAEAEPVIPAPPVAAPGPMAPSEPEADLVSEGDVEVDPGPDDPGPDDPGHEQLGLF